MKRVLLLLLPVFLLSCSSDDGNTNTTSTGCQYGQCIKIKEDGERCKNCSQEYSSYCWSHRLNK